LPQQKDTQEKEQQQQDE